MVGTGEREELIFPAGWALLPDFTEHRESKIFDLIAMKCQVLEPNWGFSDFGNVTEYPLLIPFYRAHHNQTRIQNQANHIPVTPLLLKVSSVLRTG